MVGGNLEEKQDINVIHGGPFSSVDFLFSFIHCGISSTKLANLYQLFLK